MVTLSLKKWGNLKGIVSGKRASFTVRQNFTRWAKVLKWLEDLGYADLKTCQTIFQDSATVKVPQPVKEGHGEGVFVVIAGEKSGALPSCWSYPVLMPCQNFSLLMILGINKEKTKSPREKNTFQVRRLAH